MIRHKGLLKPMEDTNMSNYLIVWNSWIFGKAAASHGAAAYQPGYTASEMAAFERAMERKTHFSMQ